MNFSFLTNGAGGQKASSHFQFVFHVVGYEERGAIYWTAPLNQSKKKTAPISLNKDP